MRKLLLAAPLILLTAFAACGEDDADDGAGTPECAAGHKECTDDGLRTCAADGAWGDPDPCPSDEICHAMGGGQDHCMLPGAMPMGEGEGEGEQGGMDMGEGEGEG